MTLLEELKDRHAKVSKELDEAREREEALHKQILDLEKAIGGIDPSFWEDDEFDDDDGEYDDDEIDASSQSEPFVSLAAETDLQTSPGEVEESRDHSEKGYAPVTQAEPLADPIWNEPEPTDPQADALAKAADYYSPEAVAERNRFNPFAMFRKEGDQ